MGAVLPAGTAIAGYNKGTFEYESPGDKAVNYAFNDLGVNVIFEKEFTNLEQALGTVNARMNATGRTCSLLGHIISYDEQTVTPDNDWSGPRYFVPFESNFSRGIQIIEYGQFANDLAYNDNLKSKEEYDKR